MYDRGFIKWQPFNSVFSNKEMLQVTNNKSIDKPILFSEKKEEISRILEESYYANNVVTIFYYEKNQIITITEKIVRLNSFDNTIILANGKVLLFNLIIDIK